MAQKREKEETELKVPESLSLCAPAIPVSPPPHLSGLSDDPRSSSARSLAEGPDPNLSVNNRSPSERSDLGSPGPGAGAKEAEGANRSLKRPREAVNRCSCSGCRRKLGLMGFRCRCGDMFCSEHRYSDRHVCSYDYKAAGQEAIARENPVVKAAKILKV